MKRGKRILALVLSLSMLLVAFPINELQARTIDVPTTQETELFSDDFNNYGGESVEANQELMVAKGWNTVDTAAAYIPVQSTTYVMSYDSTSNSVTSNVEGAENWTDYVVEATFVLEDPEGVTVASGTNFGIVGRTKHTSYGKGYELVIIKNKNASGGATLRLRYDATKISDIVLSSFDVGEQFKLKLEFKGKEVVGSYEYGEYTESISTTAEEEYNTSGYAGINKISNNATGRNVICDDFRVYTTETVNQQEEVLYSLNGTAYSENGSAEDNSCLYYDTFAVEGGYTSALGDSDVTGVATYSETNQKLSIGGFTQHRIVPFAGITDASTLTNYMISADIVVETDSAIAGVSAYTDGTVRGYTGYEFYVSNAKLYLRCRATSEVVVNGVAITNYFSEYTTGDTIRLILALVTTDEGVDAAAIISYQDVNKLVSKCTFTGEDRRTNGIPALRAQTTDSTATLYTADNVLVETVVGGVDSVINKMIKLELSNIILNIGADKTQRNFNWQTNLDLDCKLQYGLKSDMVEGTFPTTYTEVAASKDNETAGGTVAHKSTISDLADNTEYVYRIVSGELASDLYYFSTGDMADGFTFAFAGDPQVGRTDMENDEEGWETTVDAILDQNVDFMLSSGDQVHQNDTASYNKFFYNKLAGLTTATIVGNHDNNAMYNDYFNMPNVSEQYGAAEAEGDYYFVYGNTLFMCLNTNNLHADTPNQSLEDEGVEPLTDQVKEYNKAAVQEHVDFMTEVVEAYPDVIWKTVVFHQSIYSVSAHRDDLYVTEIKETLEPTLIDLDIDVVLMGHDHCYARTYMMNDIDTPDNANGVQSSVLNSNGILYITADSASGNKYGAVATEDYAAVTSVSDMDNRRPTFSVMNVTNNEYEIVTYYSDNLEELDRFTINKNVDVNNDGKSNADDIVEMRKMIIGSSTFTPYSFDDDDDCDVVDLVALKKYTKK